MAWLFKTDGSKEMIEPKNGKFWELKELYELIGCSLVQWIDLEEGWGMWIDEEGKLVHMPLINVQGTREWVKVYGKTDIIVGNAILTETKYLQQ